jgi:hypothetical protein
MTYSAAEAAYRDRRFPEALEAVTSHLHQEPDDLRALLLQAYILSFGLQDDAGASAVYRQVIERAGAEGAYRELAEEGLRQCGAAGPSPAAAAERAVIPVLSPGDDDAVERLPATPWLQEEPQLVPAPGPAPPLQLESPTEVSPEPLANQAAAGEAALEAGWLLVDLRG